MPTKPTYEIYCLYHNQVNKKYYGNQIDQVTFVKMDRGPYIFKSKKHIHLVNESWFHSIGKEWAEYEFYYSLYQGYKKGLIELPEYLGFIQYDMEFKGKEDKYKNTSVIDFVEGLIESGKLNKDKIILFQFRNFDFLYNENFIIDPEKSSPINSLETITKEYNIITNNNLKLSDIKDKDLSICGSFFIHKNIFINMMSFLSIIIQDNRLEKYNKKERIQGTLSERYLAIFIHALNLENIKFDLPHHFLTTSNEPFLYLLQRNIGKIGYFLKSKYPKIYKFLKPYFPDRKNLISK